MRLLETCLLMSGMLSVLSGCSSTVEAIFTEPMPRVQGAAIDSVLFNGFAITTEENNLIEGYRPRVSGLFLGAGGEGVEVELTETSPTQTAVTITSSKTMLGYGGQSYWQDAILEEMRRTLEP